MENTNSEKNILSFIHIVERLKWELRHSWTSTGRQESVADHSWRLALLLMLCAPYLEKKFNLLRALQLAIIHDIGEAKIGDLHYLEVNANKNAKDKRTRDETKAVEELAAILDDQENAIVSLWKEYEAKDTYESKIVNALDKLEVCIQHNEADIATWTQEEFDSIEQYFIDIETNDNFICKLKRIIQLETFKKNN